MVVRRLIVPRIRERTIAAATAQGPDYLTKLCAQAPHALDVVKGSDLRRITEWQVDCKECHALVLDLLFEWVITDNVPIYLAQGDKPGKAVLYGEPKQLPGREPIGSVWPKSPTTRAQEKPPTYTWVPKKRGAMQNVQDEKEKDAISQL